MGWLDLEMPRNVLFGLIGVFLLAQVHCTASSGAAGARRDSTPMVWPQLLRDLQALQKTVPFGLPTTETSRILAVEWDPDPHPGHVSPSAHPRSYRARFSQHPYLKSATLAHWQEADASRGELTLNLAVTAAVEVSELERHFGRSFRNPYTPHPHNPGPFPPPVFSFQTPDAHFAFSILLSQPPELLSVMISSPDPLGLPSEPEKLESN